MKFNKLLVIAGLLSFIASLLHIACIFGGPDWYRFFGAGEHMAQLAKQGSTYPTFVTLIISAILVIWGLYALSGAGVILKLPLLKTALVLITAIYLVRGIAGLIIPFLTTSQIIHHNSMQFWIISSVVCSIYGLFYLLGTLKYLRTHT
ncbi:MULTISPECIES: hypothetical protein [Pseudoalteromonas]|uniref:Uncharacterized protein n=1 Tax=Pseudoalteromonas undina TaxID=43660 RepID=A0ACC6RA37_9GAMM|nr:MULTISPECIES: hypothetical protein [unclassified Pseudoalteromonas]KPZ51975.1 hypothetical protein AN393_03635 [Pseudoalteromonas sp. P1-25]KPZ58765.1 hypothetical protein AN391_01447 [Pseudoalteromonas sp. P1-13-1a]